MADAPTPEPPRVPLRTVAGVFLRLGATAFGGPAAHIALMEEEIVRRRGWISREEFVDLIGAVNLIPGPNSTEMAIHIGRRVGGWAGLLIAGVCFILPAALLVTLLAWAYREYGQVPAAVAIFKGVQPVVIAVILQALVVLGRTALKSPLLVLVAVAAAVLAAVGVHELAILLGAGVYVALVRRAMRRTACIVPLVLGPLPAVASGVSLPSLFWVFLKIGAILFGSGYVLVAYLRADLVERHQWISEQELMDAIAVGQVTPGPVTTTATFLGYLLGGPAGAMTATVAIFLPAFVFVALSGPLVPRLRRSAVAGAVLDGVNAASLALMGVAAYQLGRASLTDWPSVVVAGLSALVLVRWKVNSMWLIGAGLVFGAGRWVVGA
jgi:chromate transporter